MGSIRAQIHLQGPDVASLVLAWGWLKRNWKTVLLGVFTLGIGLLVGKAFKKGMDFLDPELAEAEKAQRVAQELEDAERVKAAKKRAELLIELEVEHKDLLKQLTDEQRSRVEVLKDNPDELNAYLLSVGKEIRG